MAVYIVNNKALVCVHSIDHCREKPLAMYIFSKDKPVVERILTNTSSGDVTVNDTLMHFSRELNIRWCYLRRRNLSCIYASSTLILLVGIMKGIHFVEIGSRPITEWLANTDKRR